MPTRAEKIAFIKDQLASRQNEPVPGAQQSAPSRDEKIAFIKQRIAESNSETAPKEPGKLKTALEGFGQGATLGYLPELQAATAKPIYAVLNYLTGQNVQPGTYKEELANNVKRQSEEAVANPRTAMLSKVAGGVTSAAAATPLLPAAEATIPARLVQAGRIGAVMGGAANTGHGDGLNLPQRIENAGKGIRDAVLTAGLFETPGLAKSGVRALANKADAKIDYTPIENADDVTQAAKNIGIDELPKGVLTDNPNYQKFESGLSQSGSFPARSIKKQYNQLHKGLEKASEKIADLKTPESTFAIGQDAKESFAKEIAARREPVSEMYDELNTHLKNIPVNEGVVNKAFGALKKNPMFQTKDGAAMLEEFKALAKDQPDLASLKEFRTSVQDSVGKTASPLEIKRAQAIRQTITKIRDNSVNALKADLPASAHAEVDNLIDHISLADQAHATNIKDLNSIKSILGNKEFDSPSTFAKQLESMGEEQLAKRMANADVSTMRNLQEKFPEIYNKAKIAKVNEIIGNSSSPVSGFSETRFLKQYEKMPQEMRDLVFPKEIQNHLSDLATVKRAIPERLGPSGTPEGEMTMEAFSPRRNLLDYGIKKTLEKSTKPLEAPSVSTTQNVLRLLSARPTTSSEMTAQSLPAAADNKSEPKKGPTKWANDGFKKLQQHAKGKGQSFNGERGAMLSDPKTKSLLIAASDLKPGSKAMDQIMTKIKNRSERGKK